MLHKKFYILLFLCCQTTCVLAGDSITGGRDLPDFKNPAGLPGRPRIGLVLSGGGAKGIAHVGALKVIEELGIPIDYIGGTSMGSIVGGLYALGYTSAQLENYLKEADWEYLLTSRVLRPNVSIYEKGERKRYWMQFPVRGGRIELPLGILSGQNVSNLFCELASPAYDQPDFAKFPTPFLCVATDIEAGGEAVLEHGDLSKAMRASMAIPTIFTPEVIDGKKLFDGGLTNNFPTNLVRDKGMDILIGVDVTSQEQTEEYNNIYQIMDRVVFMSSQPLKDANRKLCRILITPDMTGYSTSSFNAVDSLIVRGERATRLHYGELKDLAAYLDGFEPDGAREHDLCPQPLQSFYVKDIVINGLNSTTKEFFIQKSGLDFPAELTFDRLNKAVDQVRGTQFFLSIVYHLNPLPDGAVELQFDCIEHSANLIRVGMHYDQEYRAALLLSLTLRNFLLNDSKASVEMSIGANPSFSLSYFHSPRFLQAEKKFFRSRLSPDWMFNVDGYRFDAYNYLGNQRTTGYTFYNLSSGIQILISPSIRSAIGAGIFGDYTVINTFVGNDIADVRTDHLYMISRLFYERDTYNEDYFPTKGYKYRLEGNYHKGLSKNDRFPEGFFGIMFRSNFAFTPVDRWTLHTGVDAGSLYGSNILPHYHIRLGGMPDRQLHHQINFLGMYFLQQYDRNAWVAHQNHQVRIGNNVYVTFRFNLAKTGNELTDLIIPTDFKIGYGVSVQYNSVVGPLGFTLSSSNVTKSLLGALHFGFWF